MDRTDVAPAAKTWFPVLSRARINGTGLGARIVAPTAIAEAIGVAAAGIVATAGFVAATAVIATLAVAAVGTDAAAEVTSITAAPDHPGDPGDPARFQVRSGQAHWTPELTALFGPSSSESETAAVWVYLRDKEIYDSDTCLRALVDHAQTLEPAALRRRQHALPEPWVDFYDLPTSERYLTELRSLEVDIRHVSRWLNAVSVNVTRAQLEEILVLSFVSDARPVRRGISDRQQEVQPGTGTAPVPAQRPGDAFDYGPSRRQLELMNVLRVHEAGYSGDGVIVAIFDTGFMLDHEAFASLRADGRLLDQYDFVNDDANVDNEPTDNPASNAHGTSTWSVLGGFAAGDLVGAAHGASFLLCKTEDIMSETSVEEDNWVAAAEWAEARGAQVFSTSLTYIAWYDYSDLDGDTAPMTIASDIAASRGIAVCVAAGNQGGLPWYYIGVPADADSVLAVGAVDSANLLAEFSSHGPTADGRLKPEVVAQGVDTYAAIPNTFGSDFFPLSGTSMSAPLVAGAAALILEANPSWTGWQVREALLRTAVSFTIPNNDRGWGLVDVWGAIHDNIPAAHPLAARTPTLTAWPVPSSGTVHFRLDGPDAELAGSVDGPAGGIEGGGSDGDSDRDPSPNGPAPDRLGAGWQVQIFDPSGRRVFETQNATATWSWNGRSSTGRPLRPGVYFVRATSEDWQATQKIVLRP